MSDEEMMEEFTRLYALIPDKNEIFNVLYALRREAEKREREVQP